MSKLFTYCIPYDDGAAPNPYWGVCTLVICKPKIRRYASIGDWVVGTGSKNTSSGDYSGKVVYAMKVSEKMTMEEYDKYTHESLPEKIPDWRNSDIRKRLGDSVYDFSQDPPIIRRSVHNEENRDKDLRGEFALLSNHFFYFGDNPVELPENLNSIVLQGQGHRSNLNAPYFQSFVEWIYSLGYELNSLNGDPEYKLFENEDNLIACAEKRRIAAEEDEKIPDSQC